MDTFSCNNFIRFVQFSVILNSISVYSEWIRYIHLPFGILILQSWSPKSPLCSCRSLEEMKIGKMSCTFVSALEIKVLMPMDGVMRGVNVKVLERGVGLQSVQDAVSQLLFTDYIALVVDLCEKLELVY